MHDKHFYYHRILHRQRYAGPDADVSCLRYRHAHVRSMEQEVFYNLFFSIDGVRLFRIRLSIPIQYP